METCINDYNMDLLAQIIERHYQNNGYNLDVHDKKHYLLYVNFPFTSVEESKIEADDNSTLLAAQGKITIPYVIFSDMKSNSSSSETDCSNS